MQKLFPSVSEAASAGPVSPNTPEAKQPAAETPEPAAPVVRPFAWPPPEEDLDDWHVFKFAETPTSTPEPPPTAPAQELKESETPTLKIVSPYAEKQLAGHALTPGDLADAALADTAEISNDDDSTNPQVVTPPQLVAPPHVTPLVAPPSAASPSVASPSAAPPPAAPPPTPATFRTPDTEPIVVPLLTPTKPVAQPTPTPAAASLSLSGALRESGTALPVRRVVTPPLAPTSKAPAEPPLMSATVDVIARSAQVQVARSTRSWSWVGRAIVIALALLATGEAAYIATLKLRAPAAAFQTAVLFVQSQPADAEILIDGQSRGRTPFRAELPPGQHTLELRKDRVTRKFPLVLAAGTSASQYVEMRAAEVEPAPPSSPGATGTKATAATATAAAVAPPPAPVVRPAPSVGWLLVQSPVQLSILRNGESIGNSDDGRIAIVPGHHELELSNNAAGYREATTIQILPGQLTTLRPELPQSTLDVEATPTARVLIDGREVGETPLTQIALTIGPHDILLRHPDFPDRRVSTFIKVGTPSRVSVDLTTP